MADEWIVRVQGKEYGPVDVEELRVWQREGRLIRENEVREPGSEHWFPASELVEVFGDGALEPPPTPVIVRRLSFGEILAETWRVYRWGFWRFLGLAALVVVPSVCAQLSGVAVSETSTGAIDLRAGAAAMLNLTMLLLSLAAWPLYIGGIQILTRDLVAGRPITFSAIVQEALRSWWTVAMLCLLVYAAFFLLVVLGFAVLLFAALGGSSLLMILLALLLLAGQVWMFSRFFINVLFWQQPAVLEHTGVLESLRRSMEIARSGQSLPWLERPLWRGVLLASLWSIVALGFSFAMEWSNIADYFRVLATTHDPQALVEWFRARGSGPGISWPRLCLQLLQAGLRPLLGISFVITYLEARAARRSS